MATRLGLFVITVVLLVACSLLLAQSEALYVPKNRATLSSATGDVAKRSTNIGQRQKRYTDYQERASAFCTGLCMYEERKSYSECFDLCNWHLSQGPNYKVPSKQSSYIVGPLAPTVASTPSDADADYSNDEGVLTAEWSALTSQNPNKQSPTAASSDSKRRKGRKSKADKGADSRKRLLRELKRKLLRDIDSKQEELAQKAMALQERIGSLETEIELGKQTIADFEQRLELIKLEMAKIDSLKANITALIKGSRKLAAAGKKLRPEQLLPAEFLLPENHFTGENITELLNEFLVDGSQTKRSEPPSPGGAASRSKFELYEPERTSRWVPTDKSRDLGQARNNLETIVSNGFTKEYVADGM